MFIHAGDGTHGKGLTSGQVRHKVFNGKDLYCPGADINDDHGFLKFGEFCYHFGIALRKYIDRQKIYGIGNIFVLVEHPSVFVVIVKEGLFFHKGTSHPR